MGRAARLALLAAASTLAAAGPATLVAAFNIPTTGAILRSSTRPTTPTCHQCRRAAQSPLSTASATSTFFVPGSDRRHVRATIGIAPATALGEGGVRGKRQAFFSAKTATTRMLMGETESASAWTGKQRSSLSSTGKTTLGGGFREGGGSAGARSQRTALGATATRQLRFLEDGKPVVVTHDDGQRKWNKCNEFVELGTSGLMVSKIGFGGIMIGGQMDEEQTHTVLNHAFDKAGINWLDTSETYPHPIFPDHKFKADPIVGSWLKTRDRSKVILCTKVAGYSEPTTWLRKDGSHTCLTRDQILESVEGSLERMGTDYVDMLYIGEWPERKIVDYGSYYYISSEEHKITSDIEEQLMAVQELVDQGVVRHVACGNETPFGVTKFVEHATWDDMPKIACVQSPYNLLTQNRVEMGLLEACSPKQCNVGIVATTPLAGGGLSGKYMYERLIEDKDRRLRFNMFPGFQGRFNSKRIYATFERYKVIAARYGLTMHEMALAYVHNKSFITASLMGATSPEQIDQNIGTLDIKLPPECLAEIISVQDDQLEPTIAASVFDFQYDHLDPLSLEYGELTDDQRF